MKQLFLQLSSVVISKTTLKSVFAIALAPSESLQLPSSSFALYVSPPGHALTQTAVNIVSMEGAVSVKYLNLYSEKSLAFGTVML